MFPKEMDHIMCAYCILFLYFIYEDYMTLQKKRFLGNGNLLDF
jgi:hypothetical protein